MINFFPIKRVSEAVGSFKTDKVFIHDSSKFRF